MLGLAQCVLEEYKTFMMKMAIESHKESMAKKT